MPRDSPTTDPDPSPEINLTKGKARKAKKKRKHLDRNQTSASSSSSDVDSVPPKLSTEESSREEYYDARESYHALPEHHIPSPLAIAPGIPTNPLLGTPLAPGALMLTYSEEGRDPSEQLQGILPAPRSQGQNPEHETEDFSTINKLNPNDLI